MIPVCSLISQDIKNVQEEDAKSQLYVTALSIYVKSHYLDSLSKVLNCLFLLINVSHFPNNDFKSYHRIYTPSRNNFPALETR
jgi:hypothetical protein